VVARGEANVVLFISIFFFFSLNFRSSFFFFFSSASKFFETKKTVTTAPTCELASQELASGKAFDVVICEVRVMWGGGWGHLRVLEEEREREKKRGEEGRDRFLLPLVLVDLFSVLSLSLFSSNNTTNNKQRIRPFDDKKAAAGALTTSAKTSKKTKTKNTITSSPRSSSPGHLPSCRSPPPRCCALVQSTCR